MYFHRRFDRAFRSLSILIVVLIALFCFLDWRAFQTASKEADETRQILHGARAVLSSLKDAETGQRGYLLTGDKKYLTPYKAALAVLPRQLGEIWTVAVASGRQVQRIARLQALTLEKLEEVKRTVALRDQEGPESALALVLTDQGQITMNNLRNIGDELEKSEDQNFKDRSDQALGYANRSHVVTLAGCMVLLVWMFGLGRAVDTVIADREGLANSLAESRQELETTLASIGDAVISTDSEGKIRFINPIAASLTEWTEGAAHGRRIEEVMPIVEERTRKPVESPVQEVLREGAVANREIGRAHV